MMRVPPTYCQYVDAPRSSARADHEPEHGRARFRLAQHSLTLHDERYMDVSMPDQGFQAYVRGLGPERTYVVNTEGKYYSSKLWKGATA